MTAFFAKHHISPFHIPYTQKTAGAGARPLTYIVVNVCAKVNLFCQQKIFGAAAASKNVVFGAQKSSLAKGSFCRQQENFCLTCSILGRSACCAGYQPFSCIFSAA
jgi:hypothetical protein